ncbi:hypothetical protein [Nostoc sp.]
MSSTTTKFFAQSPLRKRSQSKLALKAGKIFDDDPYYFKVKHD